MKKIIVVTDSNSGIKLSEANELNIKVIPMPFLCNQKTYYEGVNLTQEEFYQKLENNEDVSTSQPIIGEVVNLWDKLLKEYDEIIQIPMSSGLSMACETAYMFSQNDEYKNRVFVVNNMRISVTQRRSVLRAVNLINEGKEGKQIKEILEKEALSSSIYITVDTLKYLKKGGRITPSAALLASLLGIKPILQIQGGKLDAFNKVRGMKIAKKVMINAIKEDINNRFNGEISKVYIDVAHTNNEKEANLFLDEIKKEFPNAKGYYVDSLSLSVACHIGPNSLAVALVKEE